MHNKYKIRLSIKAKDDLKNIVFYIKNELHEPIIATKYFQFIKKELQTLEFLPQKYAIIDDDIIKNLQIRKLNIKNYIVFYRIDEQKNIVNIERILYNASDWLSNLE